MQLSTVAEISRAAGFNPDGIDETSSARDIGCAHGASFFEHSLVVFRNVHPVQSLFEPWQFIISHPIDAEAAWVDSTPIANMRKMTMCRIVQRQEGLTGVARDALFSSGITVQELMEVGAGTRPVPAGDIFLQWIHVLFLVASIRSDIG